MAVTSPDPDGPGAGRDAVQPPPQGYDQPPPGQGYDQPPPGQAAGQGLQPPPGPGFTPAPPVPAGYGYGEYPATAVPQGMYLDPGAAGTRHAVLAAGDQPGGRLLVYGAA